MIKKFIDFESINEGLKPSKIYKKVIIDDNFKILIGKNAQMNDILTFDVAEDYELWFHVSGVPGSHVVIKSEDGSKPNKEIIKKAAELAAQNSRASNGKIKVVYTERKNVTKNSKHNDGQVNVDYKKSNFINVYK